MAVKFLDTWRVLVSFAAVIRVVTQRYSPLTAVSGEERCVTTLITAAKETRRVRDQNVTCRRVHVPDTSVAACQEKSRPRYVMCGVSREARTLTLNGTRF